jgi:3-deoxy-D-manno-octulosonate 8-phosphate phosphatase (KDO 8-P phosphatase)
VRIQSKASRIKLLLFDVDGVLTDGRVLLHTDGTESKHFGIRDGIAMVWARRVGLNVGFLSARSSTTTIHRAAQLGITIVRQGVVNKLDGYHQILAEAQLTDEHVAYMGDDVLDLPVLGRVGLSAAPADAVAEVRRHVDWVSPSGGGAGAARELVELVMKAQGTWQQLVADYIAAGSTTASREPRSSESGPKSWRADRARRAR